MAMVSIGTVSNVLNNPGVVATATRVRVEDAMRQTGFVRNSAARQLKGLPSPVVGCVVLDMSNLFFAEIARGIEDRLAESGCLVTMCSSDLKRDREEQYLSLFREIRVRGVILNSMDPPRSSVDRFLSDGIPVVLLDTPGHRPDVCALAVDNLAGGRLAGEHLLELGHRRIAILDGGILVPSVRDRIQGAREAAASRGLDPDDVFVNVSLVPPAYQGSPDLVIETALSGTRPCTALLCYNDMAALTVVQGLRERGISVPGQVSVVGYDDLRFAATLDPPLTTVRQATHAYGWTAADLLLSEAEAGHEHRQTTFTPELVVRRSTAPPSVA
jgi:LacI family transcriptional regulator